MKKTNTIISKPFNLDILKFCNGKNNILQISDKVGLTYRTTFFKIKELEEAGIISITGSHKVGEGHKIIISEKYKNEIDGHLGFAESSEKKIKEALEDNNQKKFLLDTLISLRKKRFIDRAEFLDLFKGKNSTEFIVFIIFLELAGYIKGRFEITKKGIRLLRLHKTLDRGEVIK